MKSKKYLVFISIIFAAFMFVVLHGISVKAGTLKIEVSSEETEEYVSQVAVKVEVDATETTGDVKAVCYAMGDNLTADDFKDCKGSEMQLELTKVEGETYKYTTEFMANLNGVYTIYGVTDFPKIDGETIGTINITKVDSTADKIILKQLPVNGKLNNVIIDITIEGTQSTIIAVKYMQGRRSLNEIKSYGKDVPEGPFVATSSGYYTFYVKDKALNESIEYIKIAPAVLVNGEKRIEVNQSGQIKYLVKQREGVYYIELPKASEEVTYPANRVMVLSTYNEENLTYKVLEKTQGFSQYIVMEGDTYEAIQKDRYIVKVDPSVIGKYEEGNTYVTANFITKKEARKIGFKIALININYAIIGLGIVGVLFILFIVSRLRVKRFS